MRPSFQLRLEVRRIRLKIQSEMHNTVKVTSFKLTSYIQQSPWEAVSLSANRTLLQVQDTTYQFDTSKHRNQIFNLSLLYEVNSMSLSFKKHQQTS